MIPGSSSARAVVALGFFLARRGVTAAFGLALTVASVVGFGGAALFVARRGRPLALVEVPLLASTALAFGVGVLFAFAAATRAFRRDEDDGVRALLRARGVSTTGYLTGRVAGLAASLAVLVGGGSGVVGVIATLAARNRVAALHTAQASLAAVVFAVAFAATFAPIALATLGARSRGGGYLALLGVLALPELLQPTLARFLPPGWVEVCSIPGALLALRGAIAPPAVDPLALSRALAAVLAIILAALLVVRIELLREHRSLTGARSGRPPR